MNPSFWKGKRVFITGHTGFKGSWLSLLLTRLGSQVSGYSLDPSEDIDRFDFSSCADSICGSVVDREALGSEMRSRKPEIVIHLAAQALVSRGYANPLETYETNFCGTLHLLDICRKSDFVKACLIVTSDKCYLNSGLGTAHRESDSLGGDDPYSASKAVCEILVRSYRKSFKGLCNVATARAGNVIGGGDFSENRLLPDMMKALSNNKVPLIRNPKSIRPWQHVLEPLSGYLTLCEKLYMDSSFGGPWNFGPKMSDTRSVEWLADYVTSRWGDGLSWDMDTSGPKFAETEVLRLDTSKAQNKLGYKPRWNLKRGLRETIDWHKAFRDGKDMREFTLSQIDSFLETRC